MFGLCAHESCGKEFSLTAHSTVTECPHCGSFNDNGKALGRYKRMPELRNPPTHDPIMEVASVKPGTGQKFDGDKDEPGLLLSGCHRAVAGVIAVLGFGFRKYKERNGWKKVPEAQRRYKDALHRHLAAIERGEIYDNEPGGSGLPHIDHVACNAMFLSQMHHEGFGQ